MEYLMREITNEHYSTGTMVYFKGDEGCIAFRRDIDALPIKEDTGCDFASTNGRHMDVVMMDMLLLCLHLQLVKRATR